MGLLESVCRSEDEGKIMLLPGQSVMTVKVWLLSAGIPQYPTTQLQHLS